MCDPKPKRLRLLQAIAISTALTLFVSALPARSATIVNTFSDWTLYVHQNGPATICFLAAFPTVSQPTTPPRDVSLAYVSAWPKDGVKSEISFKIGVPLKKATEPTASITGQTASSYKLFVRDDRAFVADATQELKLLDALKKGSKLTVQAISGDGTSITDTYSLQGITAALQALAGGCAP